MGILVKSNPNGVYGNEMDKCYLTFEALENGTFTFTYPDDMEGTNVLTKISYSVDNGKTWITEEFESGTEKEVTTPTIKKGGIVLWKANGSTADDIDICVFSSTGDFNVYGNIMSLVYGNDFYGKNFDTERGDSFNSLFVRTDIVSGEYLILPNNVVEGCYQNMFGSCTSLTTAPVLTATTLAENCYCAMFIGCSSLNYIKMLALKNNYNSDGTSSLENWVKGVSDTGTFVMNKDADWYLEGNSGIPFGWNIVDKPDINYADKYFTIEALEDGQITINRYLYKSYDSLMIYRKNNGNWNTTGLQLTQIDVNKNDIIEFKSFYRCTFISDDVAHQDHKLLSFTSTCKVNVYGNILSLFYGSDMNDTLNDVLVDNTFKGLFHSSESTYLQIVDASNLILANNSRAYCYQSMFQYCVTLKNAPEIYTTNLNATSLNACINMFLGCSNLNYIKFTGKYVNETVFKNWVKNVAANGTFIKKYYQTIPTGVNGIPSGWTVINIDCEPNQNGRIGFYPYTDEMTTEQTVTLTAVYQGGVTGIKYTLDGTEPNVNSQDYYGNFPITTLGNITIKAKAYNIANGGKYYWGNTYSRTYNVVPAPEKIYTLYVDKFPTDTEEYGEYWEDAGYDTREEYIAAEVAAAGVDDDNWMFDTFYYYGDTLEYEDNTYYVCDGKLDSSTEGFQLLLSTDDYDTLYGQSLEEDVDNNSFTSLVYVFNYEDEYDDNSDLNRLLIKIINNESESNQDIDLR